MDIVIGIVIQEGYLPRVTFSYKNIPFFVHLKTFVMNHINNISIFAFTKKKWFSVCVLHMIRICLNVRNC